MLCSLQTPRVSAADCFSGLLTHAQRNIHHPHQLYSVSS